VLPKGTLKRTQKAERAPYTRAEVTRLLTDERIDIDRRVFAALAFYTGAREGEVCGLRWSDWDREAMPLGCLSLARQYGGAALKTDAPRKVPVHPELAAVLDAWWRHGFETVQCRRPTPHDHIVPMRHSKANHHGVKPHHTKSSAYKLFRAACAQAEVENRSLHATRHTFITWARRGGAPKDVLEKITHNAKGDIVDQYTHFDWEPLCEAMLRLGYVDPRQQLHRGPNSSGNSWRDKRSVDQCNGAESHEVESSTHGSIPGASTTDRLVSKGARAPGQPARQRLPGRLLTPARLLHECKDIALGARAVERPEAEVLARLRRVAKTIPQAAPPRRTGSGS
jgi:site-specific recombinase XerD